ncbi:hypothetical protein LTS15_006293 [Exophiala xenobiotica]|nr:hypothetical protein LTS15_006293 [Exophiala xenobiotica]
MSQASWQERAATKVAATAEKIPRGWRLRPQDLERAKAEQDITGKLIESFLPEHENAITRLDTTELAEMLARGSLTCLEVTTSFCKRAAVAHQINNCLHEIFFDQAMVRAKELDQHYEHHGVPTGALHGLPVSLKDQFHVKGIDTTMGYVGWIDTFEGNADSSKVHNVESQVVAELLQQGAIIYCKTSLPQTLMYGETINNLIGQTLNPINQRLSCGGSSGGEAALQALRGSTIGLGTDIGGSVRIPAAFCGTYSLKPTHNRLSYRNVANTNPGQLSYASSVGVMGTSLDGVKLLTSSLLATKPWLRDPDVVPLPWCADTELSTLARANPVTGAATSTNPPLKVGIMFTDSFMTAHPPVIRGLHILKKALLNAGHKVIDWQPPSHLSHHDLARTHLRFLQSDGGHDIHHQLQLSGEPLIPPLRNIFKVEPPFDAIKIQQLSIEGRDFCAAYTDYWNSLAGDDRQEVDAFIMPVAPHAAVMPGRYLYTGYTEVLNLLDYSAAVVPVTRADRNVDIFDESYKPFNDLDEKNWKGYDAEVYDGAPVGLQIVARKYEEEKIWAVAKIVDLLLKNS